MAWKLQRFTATLGWMDMYAGDRPVVFSTETKAQTALDELVASTDKYDDDYRIKEAADTQRITAEESATVDNFFATIARVIKEFDNDSRAEVLRTVALMFEQHGLLLRPIRSDETPRYTHLMLTGELLRNPE